MSPISELSRRATRLKTLIAVVACVATLSCADKQNGPISDPFSTSSFESDYQKGNGRGRYKTARLTISPETLTVATATAASFSALAMLADGSTVQPKVTWTATGGTIDAKGRYTAGAVAGHYRVVANAANGLADSASVEVTLAAPPPPANTTPDSPADTTADSPADPPQTSPPEAIVDTGTTYFLADAEDLRGADYYPWTPDGNLGWQITQLYGTVTNSTARAKNGGRAWRYAVTPHTSGSHNAKTLSGAPQVSMGSPGGRFLGGYYSWWMYVESGYVAGPWNLLMGWMTGVSGSPSPMAHVGMENRNGVLQLMVRMTNAFSGCYTAPSIAGYTNLGANGYYFQTASSPNGITPVPRNRWVHVLAHYVMAPTNGKLRVWQDGVLVMDLQHANLNTFIGGTGDYGGAHYDPAEWCKNLAGDMMLQFGNYGGPTTATDLLWVDDYRVSSGPTVP